MNEVNNNYLPYISDINMFKAVTYARALRKKMGTGLAITRASKYYHVDHHEVAKYLGILGSNTKLDRIPEEEY